jgi:quercetin dioxygenase-like cupin family protein
MIMSRALIRGLGLIALTLASALGAAQEDDGTGGVRPESVLVAEGRVAILAAGPHAVSAVNVSMAPGVSAVPFTTPGPLVIAVQRGTLTIGGSGRADQRFPYELGAGEVATVPAGVRIRPRNESDEPVAFLVIALVPDAADRNPGIEMPG